MPEELALLCVLAHPDDESLWAGGTLARYAAEGVATYLVCATRGERGWPPNDEDTHPEPEALGQLREAELRAATAVLGLRGLEFLDYIDGEVDQADPTEAIARIVVQLRRLRPQVVVTFAPDGMSGHPDHIALSQFTTAAVVCAADPGYGDEGFGPSYRVAKLYYLVESPERAADFDAVFGDVSMWVDGVIRRTHGWDDWAITTRVDAATYWRQAYQAVACHQTQFAAYPNLAGLPAERHQQLWGRQEFYRVFSLVNGGRAVEHDLFAGLR